MLIAGILMLFFVAIYSFAQGKNDASTIQSVGFLFIMIGIALRFPEMLMSEPKGGLSTMRVAIFMVVSVFIFLCTKIGWYCKSFAEFKMDSTWGYIIGAALGSKAVQSLGENKAFTKSSADQTPQSKANVSPGPGSANADAEIHNQSTVKNPPPDGPPSYFNKD